MRYIVKATKTHKHDTNTRPFGYCVYDGTDFREAKKKMAEYAEFGGVTFESKEEE